MGVLAGSSMTQFSARITPAHQHAETISIHPCSRSLPTRATPPPPLPPCHYCQELDHAPQDCALAPFEQQKGLFNPRSAPLSRKGKRPVPYNSTLFSLRYGSLQDYPTGSGGTRYPSGQSVSLGTKASALSLTGVHTPIYAPPAAVRLTELVTVQRLQWTQSSRGEHNRPSSHAALRTSIARMNYM